MTIKSEFFDQEKYFGDSTKEVNAFVSELIDTILPIWSDFEAGLLVTSAVFYAGKSISGGDQMKITSWTINPGSIVATKPFKGIKSSFSHPFIENGSKTPHIEHFLNAVDLGLTIFMQKWIFSLGYNANIRNFSGIRAGAWTNTTPAVGTGSIKRGDLKMTQISENLDFKSELNSQILKFVFNRRNFPKKTEFLVEFVEKFTDMFYEAVQNWLKESFIYGGTIVVVYSNTGNPLTIPAISVAHKIG